MLTQFSPELIERLQVHFQDDFGVQITKEQANEYLHSLADLYLAFTRPPDPNVAPS